MSKLEDAKKIIARMNLTEKTQPLQLILRDYGNFSLGIDINSKNQWRKTMYFKNPNSSLVNCSCSSIRNE